MVRNVIDRIMGSEASGQDRLKCLPLPRNAAPFLDRHPPRGLGTLSPHSPDRDTVTLTVAWYVYGMRPLCRYGQGCPDRDTVTLTVAWYPLKSGQGACPMRSGQEMRVMGHK